MIGGSPIPMYGSPYATPYSMPYSVPPQMPAPPRPNFLQTPPVANQYPVPPVAAPQFAGNPGMMTLPAAPPTGTGWQSGPPQTQPPVLAVQAAGQQQPKLRGSIPDGAPATRATPAPTVTAALRLPSPIELGITTPTLAIGPAPFVPIPNVQKSPPIDWNQTLARFERLGVQGFHLDRIPAGGVRATLILPGGSLPLQATGASDADAVAAVLGQAEQYARR